MKPNHIAIIPDGNRRWAKEKGLPPFEGHKKGMAIIEDIAREAKKQDIKYHNFFDAENRILMIDSGHYESEKYSTEILYDLIIKKFPKFAVRFSKTNTNPINYL